MPVLTPEDVLDRLAALGVRLVATAAGPALRRPRGWGPGDDARLADLLPLVQLHRAALVARCSATEAPAPEPEPWRCGVCRGWVYVAEAEWRGVGGALCPVEGEWAYDLAGERPVEVAPRCPFKEGGAP